VPCIRCRWNCVVSSRGSAQDRTILASTAGNKISFFVARYVMYLQQPPYPDEVDVM